MIKNSAVEVLQDFLSGCNLNLESNGFLMKIQNTYLEKIIKKL